MVDYKERMVQAKKIYDKNNPRKELNIELELTEEEKNIQNEIAKKKKYAEELAGEYFNNNKEQFINNTLEYFINCLETEKGKNVFEKQYDMKYENYPQKLVGYYQQWFIEAVVNLIKENIKNHKPDFCSFDVSYEDNLDKSEKQIDFCIWVRIIMWVNN